MGAAAGAALDARAVAPIFDACFETLSHVVLAVSGGPDSMAMLRLVATWHAARATDRPGLSVITVDHGLRPEAADEARFVAKTAAALGLLHTTLTWHGPKPESGIQVAARGARYRLISAHLAAHNIPAVAMAHTRDDQAETLLMRLARGSGADGLAGMRQRVAHGPMLVIRPLLTFSKASLIATLEALGQPWIGDPSNENVDYERVRLRRASGALEDAGLGNAQLALSARRLGRASAALETYAREVVAARPDELHFDDLGYARLAWDFLLTLPEEIRLKILARTIAAVGGAEAPVSLGSLEAMTEGEAWQRPVGRTLSGAVMSAGSGPNEVLITREIGRSPLQVLTLQPGETADLDRRFTVSAATTASHSISIRALGDDGLAHLKAEGVVTRTPHPSLALRSIPAFWDNGRLVAVPLLNYSGAGFDGGKFASRFTAWTFGT